MKGDDKKRLLLVEDEVIIAMAEKMELEAYGYTIHHVTTGEEAVQTIDANPAPVDLVLMDINLGDGIDGTVAAERILKVKDIPVVFLSSHTEPEIVKKTEKITSYGYVVKSADIVVLDASIKMALKLFDAKMKRRHTENTLRQRNEEFQMLFSNSPYGIIICDLITDDNGVHVDFIHTQGNLSTEKQTGFIVEQLVGKKASELVSADLCKDLVEKYSKVVRTKKTLHYEQYFDIYNKYLSVTAYPLSENRFVLNFIDITELKQAEENLKMQLSEKEILLREIHHRVKNNIANIESFLMLQAGSSSNTETKTALTDAVSRVKGMRILYEKLLLSDVQCDLSVKDYVEKLVDSLTDFFDADRNITVEKKIDDFMLDSQRAISIGIIINELLTNVFKYTFKDSDTGKVVISLKKINSIVTITVHDNGVGIEPEDLENKPKGLGLVIVKMLIDRLKGTYDIRQEKGTMVIIRIEI